MKKLVKLDVRDWWELMNAMLTWAELFETAAQISSAGANEGHKAARKKANEAIKAGGSYRRIVGEIEKQIGQIGYSPGVSERIRQLCVMSDGERDAGELTGKDRRALGR